jgi:hypothetical protein
VSVGAATVALVLNGLGFSHRQLCLAPQFFVSKPVEHLLGPGISAEMLHDDGLGRTLDWLYTHGPTPSSPGWRGKHASGLGSRCGRCMWTRPPLP